MKKTIAAFFLISFFGYHPVSAGAVSIHAAKNIAINFFRLNNPNAVVNTATLNYTQIENDNTVDFYVFDIVPAKGFVIVSADDNMKPVIGYSTETYFNANVPQVGITDWMNHTAAKIHYGIQQHVLADARINNLWGAYTFGVSPISPRNGTVGPLLSTTWNQEPNYNALCPFNTADNQRALTGCVATAMAQIMKYWAFPTQGKGSYSYTDAPPKFTNNYGIQSANFDSTFYQWANMPDSINSANPEIATLMYQCGVSVAMDYGDDNQGGSGAWVLQSEAGGTTAPCSQYAYVNYFSYNPNTIQGVIMANYSSYDWISLMENELDAGRVIQYEGTDPSGGHTWVCDGYDGNDMLHMNWGWGGQSDGFFDVSNLNAGNYNFNTNEAALIGIEPVSPVNVVATTTITSICPGGSTTLNAQGPTSCSYTWTPTTDLSCVNCASPVASPSRTTIYTVKADSAGIAGYATVTVTVIPRVDAEFSLNASVTCSVPAYISFANGSDNAANFIWDFGDGTNSTDLNPVHTYITYGAYTVKLLSANACGTDSITKNQIVQITDQAPVAGNQNICAGQTASISARGNGAFDWYDASTGGNLLGAGSPFSTPVLHSTTTYYVSAAIQPGLNSVGPANDSFGTGGYYTGTSLRSLKFNCTVPQTLLTVDVDAQTAGDRTIVLQDSIGGQISSSIVTIPAGLSTVTLNMAIPAQNNLEIGVTGNNGLYRNKSGAGYPYNSTDGTVSITNSNAGTQGYYYFFYNWKLQQSACVTNRTPVVVNVIGIVSNPFSATSLGNNAVNFTPSNSGVPFYSWNFGDGTTSTQEKPTHTYNVPGSYIVQLIQSNGTCADTLTQTISTFASGINELISFDNFALFPNPAKDLLNVKVNINGPLSDCQLSIHNILGETILTNNTGLNAGANSLDVNVSSFSSGVYLITLQNGVNSVTRRFVKTD